MVNHHGHQFRPVTLSFSDQITSGFYLFGFKRDFEFIAGQVIGIAMKENGPQGEFTCNEEPAVWIATGTGIAPFYSMLRSQQLSPLLHSRTGWRSVCRSSHRVPG